MKEKKVKTKSKEDYYDGPALAKEMEQIIPKVTPVKTEFDSNVQTVQNATPGSVASFHIGITETIENKAKDSKTCHASTSHSSTHQTSSHISKSDRDSSTSTVQDKSAKTFVVSKIIHKKGKDQKEVNITLKVNSHVAYKNVNDDPLEQQISREIFDTDVMFLHLKEVEDDDTEPVYEVFGHGQPLCRDHADIGSDWKINNNCPNCYIDCCDEWRFGQYCVSAVERYWSENSHTASVKGAYVQFVAHYNRVLDWHSYGEGFTHKLRPTQITKPPYCMKLGSLRFALEWIQWKIENGSEKSWYDEQRRKRKLERMEKAAEKELIKNEFKPSNKNHRYKVGRR